MRTYNMSQTKGSKKTIKAKPSMSVNKLGEYIVSRPMRRSKILKDQKYPKGFLIRRYNDARKTIVDFFTHGRGNRNQVRRKIEELIQRNYPSTWKEQDNALSIQALKIFEKTNKLDLKQYKLARTVRGMAKMTVRGVEISVEPEIIIKGSIRGVDFVGAVKINLVKGHPLNAETGRYIATVLRAYMEETYQGEKVKPEFCIALDIFTGEYFVAPRAFKALKKDIEAACDEIQALWNIF